MLVFVATLFIAGCTSPAADLQAPSAPAPGEVPAEGADTLSPQAVTGGAGGTGGRVKDKLPTFSTVSLDRTTGDNSGSTQVVLSGSVTDANAEDDISFVRAFLVGPSGSTMSVNHTVTPAERNATSEPAAYPAGTNACKVWTATANDGTLQYKCRLTVTAFLLNGAYTPYVSATNPTGVTATSAAGAVFTVTRFSLVTVASAPVNAAGIAQTGANWGEWDAFPGDANVVATNYIKITNDGDTPNAQLIIDFTEATFAGAQDAGYTVPIDGNIQFAAWEDTSPSTTSPSEGTFTFGTASNTGSVTVSFSGNGNVVYVAYRIVQLPAVLKAQSYGATFTVTEL